MSGTINLAFTQQFDMDGVPLSGGLLYFFTAGTTTPQSAFQDTGLTIVHPNPIVLDASGRVPMFYLADGFIKIRLTDKNGVTVIAADQLLVIGPSSGAGGSGGSAGDVTAALQTGDIKARYDTAVKDGFVRLNGLTIGNVGSSATERQEAVCQPLFQYLWAFPNITLEGFTKGASALADFTAGRRLILPDLRGRTIAGLDDMGNPTAASRLTSTYFGASGIALGNVGGDEKHLLTTAELAQHNHGITEPNAGQGHLHNITDPTHIHSITDPTHAHFLNPNTAVISGSYSPGGNNFGANTTGASTSSNATNIQINANATGIQIIRSTTGITINNTPTAVTSPHSIASPAMVMTWYMKL